MKYDDEPTGPEDRRLLDEVQRLPRTLEPERDLWPGIEARLSVDEQPAARRVLRGDFTFGRRSLLAAAAVLVVCVVGLATGVLRRDPAPARVGEPIPTAAADLDALDANYALVSRDVLDALARDQDLDPATVELLQRNLTIIEGAIEEIRAALADDPENAGLNRLLTAEYQRRGDVLRRAARLADAI
jgi:hypothetical protein